MRIEPAGRGSDKLRRNRSGGFRIFALQTFEIVVDPVLQLLRCRTEVGAARRSRVIALLSCRRRARLKVSGISKSLCYQLGADDLPFFVCNQAAVCSPWKEDLREARHHKWIDKA